ncbi:MAG: DUF1566 domain-containing protein [Gammaproteobacteria bacterium]|nr:DUF1566 domain-containing protein [Gammaproteobacteria bacterium]MBU2478405.1 DUF1566 domain-containing protein [Gammaproteobacteria bacterium]
MKPSILGAACGSILIAACSTVHAVAISGQGTWETALQARDLDGNLSTAEAYYDIAQNITWLADANYAMTSGSDADGLMNWSSATAWAMSLNPYGSGITGWRLPTTTTTSGACFFSYRGGYCGYNVNTTSSEMAHMFYTTLGDLAYYSTSGYANQIGWGLTNTGPFSNVRSGVYWSIETPASYTWGFNFNSGFQASYVEGDSYSAWAVHTGDVGAPTVPVPAAAWLLGSGLLGIIGVARRRSSLSFAS